MQNKNYFDMKLVAEHFIEQTFVLSQTGKEDLKDYKIALSLRQTLHFKKCSNPGKKLI